MLLEWRLWHAHGEEIFGFGRGGFLVVNAGILAIVELERCVGLSILGAMFLEGFDHLLDSLRSVDRGVMDDVTATTILKPASFVHHFYSLCDLICFFVQRVFETNN